MRAAIMPPPLSRRPREPDDEDADMSARGAFRTSELRSIACTPPPDVLLDFGPRISPRLATSWAKL